MEPFSNDEIDDGIDEIEPVMLAIFDTVWPVLLEIQHYFLHRFYKIYTSNF